MEINSKLKIKGTIEIFVNGVLQHRYLNLITNAGTNLIFEFLTGVSADYINYLAIDDGAGTYAKTTTALNNEIFRKEISSNAITGTKVTFTTFIGISEAVGDWTGLALSNGNAEGVGVLTNLKNVTFTHNSGDAVTINWSLEVL